MKKGNSRNLPLSAHHDLQALNGGTLSSQNLLIRRITRAVENTFLNLERYTYLAPCDREEFHRYEEYFIKSLELIGTKIDTGLLKTADLDRFPQRTAFQGDEIRAGMFIGSFDPFQMTHLAMALRFLASPGSDSDILFVIPEGAENKSKPELSDYGYRLELLHRQLKYIFYPILAPLNLGWGRNTVGIVDEFIRMFPGSRMTVTHVLGSDVLLWAHRLFLDDMKIWEKTAREVGTEFRYKLFILKRGEETSSGMIAEDLRSRGIPAYIDESSIGAPSSTDFRDRHALTIIFPSDDILKHMEFAFRYRMNKDWTGWRENE